MRIHPFISTCSYLCLSILTLSIAGCSTTDDEQQVRAVIGAIETAAEDRDTSGVLALVATDYRDAQGFDKQQLQQFLRGYFLLHPKIELAVNIGTIEFATANSARVVVDVLIVGTQRNGNDVRSLSGEAESLRVEFKRQDSQWRVTRADRIPR
jgi:hypothetical protein